MRYSETLQLFEQAFDFPTDRTTVVGQLGDVELSTPAGDVATVRDILNRTDEDTYHSPDELYTSLVGNLEDGFIGRKYYDDRAGIESGVTDARSEDVSL
ncbi:MULTISPECIES: hypothetical protein [Haloarcula]|uniref:DUF2795 domain-containing protein n=1 Tax=Haloarcula pellucida TaxID=1427151 RepID=A0A830GME5_9EURY|nr:MULTISPECIES: hypothetical protein [Halomicroarcula]MBX0349973.1 hypothetical protein [Halomicroarcula pellucida]MDS0279722.1 hypothetical protein [Halomicroarcula sp. S1AR25-4]GGN95300.1 hypothetical protein GCM10009030_22490 [Halomicroarcula pellucida]